MILVLLGCDGDEPKIDDTAADWFADAPERGPAWEEHYGLGADGSAALEAGRAVLPDDVGGFYVFVDGDRTRIAPFPGHDAPYGTPRVWDDVLFAADGGVVGVDLATDPPELLWEAEGGLPTLVDGLAVGRGAKGLRGFDPRTGVDAWTLDVQGDPELKVVDGTVCVIAEDGTATRVSGTGEVRWQVPALPGEVTAHQPRGCALRPDGGALRWWLDGTIGPELHLQDIASDGTVGEEAIFADRVVQRAALMDDGTFVAGGQQSYLWLDADLTETMSADDRDLLSIDPAGTVLVWAYGSHVLTDAAGSPIWRADMRHPDGVDVAASVLGETAVVVTAQHGLVASDRWSHAVAVE